MNSRDIAYQIRRKHKQPIPKTELNKRKRQQRKDAGLVEFRAWVTPEEKKALEDAMKYQRPFDGK